MIHLTDSAAEHLLDLLAEKDYSPEEKGLRLLVERGGCAGMSYSMKVSDQAEGDLIFSNGAARLFVDPESLTYLDGCHLDYVDALNDSGFKITNPKAARSCGCGTSFEPSGSEEARSEDFAAVEGEVCGETA